MGVQNEGLKEHKVLVVRMAGTPSFLEMSMTKFYKWQSKVLGIQVWVCV